jgi:L-methionine (R)-S-oxide reductase
MTGNHICAELDRLREADIDFQELLKHSVELLHESDRRFHWTGIYELYPDNILRLGPFIGSATDHVFIAVGEGVCGAAVAENRNLNIPDVSKATNYLACSAETQSELVVLIRDGGAIRAQIDIDSHELNAFDDDAARRVEQVAAWLADVWPRPGESNPATSSGSGTGVC